MPSDAKVVFQGKLFSVYQWEQELFDGTKATFEKIKRPDTVNVLPVLPDGRIVFTRQEQPGKEAFIGCIGGRIEQGEDVLEAAKRELLEESVLEADSFHLWHAGQPFDKLDWAVYTFIARGAHQVSEPHLDGGEKIELVFRTFDELLDLAKEGTRFAEREVTYNLLEARADAEKRRELEALFASEK
jgi:ADP-ribose pyrophosphatase YjhB (NUDIX family)